MTANLDTQPKITNPMTPKAVDGEKVRVNRKIIVSKLQTCFLVDFLWTNTIGGEVLNYDCVSIIINSGDDLVKVKQALRKFFPQDLSVIFNDDHLYSFGWFMDDKDDIFDLVINSDEPIQTLTCNFILNHR